jgi:phosphoribosylformimino-5-aminoimidazole carboxamide ribotide isomerase
MSSPLGSPASPEDRSLAAAVGVIDLRGGVAVRAVAGQRERYRPVSLPGCLAGDPVALALAYERLGVGGLYIADLDAITRRSDASAAALREVLSSVAPPVWIDRGWSGAPPGGDVSPPDGSANSQPTLVVASETLRDWQALLRCVETRGAERLALGIDLRDGVLLSPRARWREAGPAALVDRAWRIGVRDFVAIDLAAVGTGRTEAALKTIGGLVRRFPAGRWVAGCGIGDWSDFAAWRQLGCHGVLTASWLQRLVSAEC